MKRGCFVWGESKLRQHADLRMFPPVEIKVIPTVPPYETSTPAVIPTRLVDQAAENGLELMVLKTLRLKTKESYPKSQGLGFHRLVSFSGFPRAGKWIQHWSPKRFSWNSATLTTKVRISNFLAILKVTKMLESEEGGGPRQLVLVLSWDAK